MTTAINDKTPASANTLTALRALGGTSAESDDTLRAAERQAQLLRDLLPLGPTEQIPTHLTDLIPAIRIVHVDDIPVPGITFWARGRWNIHVRTSDPLVFQAFTILHGLKHIIDHPNRRQDPMQHRDDDWDVLANGVAIRVGTDDDCEVLANHFAQHVIAGGSHPVLGPKEEVHEEW